MAEAGVAIEKGTTAVLPRILNELADVVDKVSNTKLPITHGQLRNLSKLVQTK